MTASSPDEWSTEQPELPTEEQLPRAFGRYLLLARIAQGGMGELYLARRGDPDQDREDDLHVLKKLRPEHTRDREYVARFIDEARLVVQLSHPNICQVIDVGRVKDEYFLTMEYISGRDLRDLQTRLRDDGGALEIGDSLLIVSDVLRALAYAHERTHGATGESLHLVHRDVSPQNVMVSFTGEVKLIDFGLASSRMKLERTQPNVVMGKMAYMAPEQARGDTVDRRTDVFAAGVLAYELLVGERYYEGMTSHEIWNVVGRGDFRPRLFDSLDQPVATVLARALQSDIASRYPSANQFHDDLNELLQARYGGRNQDRLGRFMRGVYGADVRKERALVRGFDALRGAVVRDLLEGTSPHGISLASSAEHPVLRPQATEAKARPERTLVQPLPHDVNTASQNAPYPPERDPTTERSREARHTTSDEAKLPSLPWFREHEEETPPEGHRIETSDADPTTLLGLSPSTTGAGSEADGTDISGGESVQLTSLISRVVAYEEALRRPSSDEAVTRQRPPGTDSRLLLAAVVGALLLALLLWVMWVPRQRSPTGTEFVTQGNEDEGASRSLRGAALQALTPPGEPRAPDNEPAPTRPPAPTSASALADTPSSPATTLAVTSETATTSSQPAEGARRAQRKSASQVASRPAQAVRGGESGSESRERDAGMVRSRNNGDRGAVATNRGTTNGTNPAPEVPPTSARTTVKDNVAAVLRCGLPSPCGKGEIGAAYALRYRSMNEEEKRRFEAQVAMCLTRCQR